MIRPAGAPDAGGIRLRCGAAVVRLSAALLLFALPGCAYDSVSVFVGVDPGAVGFPLPRLGLEVELRDNLKLKGERDEVDDLDARLALLRLRHGEQGRGVDREGLGESRPTRPRGDGGDGDG